MNIKTLLEKMSAIDEAADKKESTTLTEGETTYRRGDKGETIKSHRGSYGTEYQGDSDDDEGKKKEPEVKRGRGRPKLGSDSKTGEVKKWDTDTLASWIIGNKPKTLPKGVSTTKHKLKDWLERVEATKLAESIVAEGSMSEIASLIDDVKSGELSVLDVLSGRYQAHSKAEQVFAKQLQRKYDEIAAERGLHPDDDFEKIEDILVDEIDQVLSEEDQVTMSPAQTNAQVIKKGANVIGQVNDPQLANVVKQAIATGKMTLAQESKQSNINMISESYDLKDILATYPHEHKMAQEGWGMDEGLYEALADHYHREGKIPRKVWHGSLEELRKYVEQCYLQDTQDLMGESYGSMSEEDFSNYSKQEMDVLSALPSSIKVNSTPTTSTTSTTSTPTTSTTSTPTSTTTMPTNEEDDQIDEIAPIAGALAGRALAGAAGAGAVGRTLGSMAGHAIASGLNSDDDTESLEEFSLGKSTDRRTPGSLSNGRERIEPSTDSLPKFDRPDSSSRSSEDGMKSSISTMRPRYMEESHEDSPVASAITRRILTQRQDLLQKYGPSEITQAIDELCDSLGSWDDEIGSSDVSGWVRQLEQNLKERLDEYEVEEGNEFSGALAKAKASGAKEFKVDGKTYPVKEGKKAKPDFLDIDKDGNKKETMKKAVKDKEKMDEAWDTDYKTPESEKGKYKDKTISDLKKMKADLMKKEKRTKQEQGKVAELNFAIRAKQQGSGKWGKVKEGDTEQGKSEMKESEKMSIANLKANADERSRKNKITKLSPNRMTKVDPSKVPAAIRKARGDEPLSYKDLREGDEQIKNWEKLLQLKLNEGITVTNTTEKQGAPETISVSATDEEAEILKKLLQSAGLEDRSSNQSRATIAQSSEEETGDTYDGTGSPAVTVKSDDLSDAPANATEQSDELEFSFGDNEKIHREVPVMAMPLGMAMSRNPEVDVEAEPIEPATPEDVIDDLSKNADEKSSEESDSDHGTIIALIRKMIGHGADVASNVEERKEDDSEKHENVAEESEKCPECGHEECECDHESEEEHKKDDEKVNESTEMCNECGYEITADHKCSSEMSDDYRDERLTEWANSQGGKNDDEQFKTEIEYMTKLISGGLNNMKQDQTTLPSTRVKTAGEVNDPDLSIAAQMRKLSGIN